jgi:hypothetical protein
MIPAKQSDTPGSFEGNRCSWLLKIADVGGYLGTSFFCPVIGGT